MDKQTDFLDGRIFGRTVSPKVLGGLSNGLSKKFLMDGFGHFLFNFWANFGIFGQFFGKAELFP